MGSRFTEVGRMIEIILPKQGLQMTEGTITRWLVEEGGRVAYDQPLFEMETDKVAMEVNAKAAGILLKIVRQKGETVPVSEVIGYIGEPGEASVPAVWAPATSQTQIAAQIQDAAPMQGATPAPAAGIQTPVLPASTGMQIAKPAGRPEENRIFITPRARAHAEEAGVNICNIRGTGGEGLIIERDVLNIIQNAALPDQSISSPAGTTGRILPFSGMRKTVAQRMMTSLHGMAQANHRIKVDMSGVVKLREELKNGGLSVSYTDILVKAVAKALKLHPEMNAELTDQGIWLKDEVNIGIAVALEQGLVVPVLRNADQKSLAGISQDVRELIEKARNGKLSPEDMTGGTFTVTNLGMYDLDSFTAIINPPESAILAVGKIDRVPVVAEGEVVIRPVCCLSLTYDHRIIDGAPAARFLQQIKQLLQHPLLML